MHESDTTYIECIFRARPVQPAVDILIAQLGEIGFESFLETEEGLQAYIPKKDWHRTLLGKVPILDSPDFSIQVNTNEVPPENWNEVWERDFEAIQIGNRCHIRAPFHPKAETLHDIVIEPKMSFGTGHHETTRLMVQLMLDSNFKGKSVLDMGSGTGILAILAAKMGASEVEAIDIDPWCYENTQENIRRNDCEAIQVFQGDAALLGPRAYDRILANINRNVLLQDLPKYVGQLGGDGQLFLSGFYDTDVESVEGRCQELGLRRLAQLQENKWTALQYGRR